MTNKPKSTVIVTGADLMFTCLFSYLAIAESALWWIAIPYVVAGFFINPRWSKSTGWRFKHDQ